MRSSVILIFYPCSTKAELKGKVIVLQFLLLEKYRGPDLNGGYGPDCNDTRHVHSGNLAVAGKATSFTFVSH